MGKRAVQTQGGVSSSAGSPQRDSVKGRCVYSKDRGPQVSTKKVQSCSLGQTPREKRPSFLYYTLKERLSNRNKFKGK